MLAAEAIEGAIAARSARERIADTEIFVEWSGSPGWRLLRSVTAIRSLLGDMFGCRVEIVASGPGCFYARYALDLPPSTFLDRLDGSYRERLALLRRRFGAERMTVRANNRSLSIF